MTPPPPPPIDVGYTLRDLTGDAPLGAADAERIARSVFGLEGTAQRLDGEYDDNFLLTGRDGARYVLKVAPANQSRDLLDLQSAALAHVHGRAPDAGVPRLVPDVRGDTIAEADVAGTRRLVRCLSFIPGTLLTDVRPRNAALLRSLGATVATLDRALADFDHPAARRALQWDLARAGDLRTDIAAIASPPPERRALVTRWLDRVAVEVLPVVARLRASVIHGDINDHNVVVDRERGHVAGLIDFGDMVHTATICDLAIACAYVMADAHDPLGAAAHVVAGFDAVLPLEDAERRVLFPLALTRLAMSVIISAARAARAPGNDYYTVHESRAWGALEALHDVSWETAGHVLFGTPSGPRVPGVPELLARRRASLGPNLSLSYREPLHIARGWRQYLYDADGVEYLDAYNNVAHVGHSHPRVVEAIARQAALLNTNTRYLHRLIEEYAERLRALFPAPLSVCWFVNSGSEANELALRLARAHTRQRDVIVSAGAYHGSTQTLIDVSPYKYAGPGGEGRPPLVHEVPMPDVYRGAHRGADAGARYAAHVAEAVDVIRGAGRGVSAFLFESMPSVGGQIIPPRGYLEAAYAAVRAAGGMCIADEVQVGLGRIGTHLWGFEPQGVVPDIVVCGKPIGNGHPLGAVITTPAIASSFATGMEYFNTFGGNPVSMAAGLAVLDVLEEEGLRAHALRAGDEMLARLRGLMDGHPLIGDVRGAGLFVGVELVRDRATQEPADASAADVVNALRDRGILTGTEGPHHNVIKIRPPMPFDAEDAERLCDALDEVLGGVGQERASV